MNLETLLAQPHLSVLAPPSDVDLARVHDAITHKAVVSGRAELEVLLGELLALDHKPAPKTLDLIGHSVAGSSLLQLGDWVLDGASSVVSSYFHELADMDVLPRLGIHSVRLLGSLTGDTGVGQWTICALSDILGLEVLGTKNLIFGAHFDAAGFSDEHRGLLARSSDLRSTREAPSTQPLLLGQPSARVLDVDQLPHATLAELGAPRWPRRFAVREAAGELLHLVRRGSACSMPGLLLAPQCEVLLPGPVAGSYHAVQILLDGTFVKVHVDGRSQPPLYYLVTQPRELLALVDKLPQSVIG